MPPCTEPEALAGEALVRAVRRAAWHPWRDAQFWRRAAGRVAASTPAELASRDLAQICLAFRRIDFASPTLANYCERYMEERRQAPNTFELAAIAAYFAAACSGSSGTREFVQMLADEVCAEWRQREAVPWSAWKMLVAAAADTGTEHRKLFETASMHLARNAQFMHGRDAAEVCAAYAAFGFKHNGLLGALARFLPSMGLTDAEVQALQEAFVALGFDAPMLSRIRELRGRAAGARRVP